MLMTFRGLGRSSLGAFIAVVAAASLIAGCSPPAQEPPPPAVASPAPKPKPAPGKKGMKKHSFPLSSRQQRDRQRALAAQQAR